MPSNNLRQRYASDGAGVVSQPRLLIMVFDRLVSDLRNACENLSKKNFELVNSKLCNAQAILFELHTALDTEIWPEGEGLSQLYLWLSQELMTANAKKDRKMVETCLGMIEQLQDGWHQAFEQTQHSPKVEAE